MDDLIARIVARLERNAADHRAIADMHGLTAGTWDRGKGEGFGSAARLVRQMWEEEQARIVEEERGDYALAEAAHNADPWEPVRELPPTVAWHEEGR